MARKFANPRQTLRDKFRPCIAEIIAANGGKSRAELRRIFRAAFPCGQRAYHPYEVWLDEIRVQLGEKKPLAVGGRKKVEPAPGQGELFDG